MKVLLTGGNGMVGRNILEHTEAAAYEFLAPSSAELDLLEFKAVETYFAKHKPEIVIHCAGIVGGIQANIREPVRFLTSNFEMGKNVLMAAKKFETEKVINIASSCMYPKDCNEFLDENDILKGPLEPTNEGYALAKISVMKLGQYINHESQLNKIKTFIPCNLYGRWDKFGDNNSHMLPAVIKKIHKAVRLQEESVEIWGTGLARREFMYAADLADFIFFSLAKWDQVPGTINVGLGHDHTVKEYYEAVAKVLGYSGQFHHDLQKPEGMKRKVVSIKKAEALEWKASTSLVDGIRKTYEFFLQKG